MEMKWDPEIDSPAYIAIIGGGPIGIEAALYARFLGYSVLLLERSTVGDSLLRWGNWQLDANAALCTSSLGLAALEAQEKPCSLPLRDMPIANREYVEEYLIPLAKTDLVGDSVQIQSEVVSISRLGCDRSKPLPIERRAEQEFRVHVRSRKRGEFTQLVDLVLDCSGLGSRRAGMASGGGRAVHEELFCRTPPPAADPNAPLPQSPIPCGRRDVLGRYRDQYAGKHCVLFGNGVEACGTASDLYRLATEVPNTKVTWVLPRSLGQPRLHLELSGGVDAKLKSDAEALCAGRPIDASEVDSGIKELPIYVVPMAAWGIERLSQRDEQGGFCVQVQTKEDESVEISCDEVINCATPLADWSFTSALAGADQLQSLNAAELDPALYSCVTAEPHYYVLGQKSLGDLQSCSIAQGLDQVRGVFQLIGGRRELDLYGTVTPKQPAM